MSTQLLQIPGILSTTPSTMINAIITASMKGVKIYLTETALVQLKPYFEKIGIKVREAKIDSGVKSYILITVDKANERIKVEIHDGMKVTSRSFKMATFLNALEEYVRKREGSGETTKIYELDISKDLLEKLKKLGEK